MSGTHFFAGPVFEGLDPRFFIIFTLWIALPPVLFVAAIILGIRDIIKKQFSRSTKIVIISFIAVVILRMIISSSV